MELFFADNQPIRGDYIRRAVLRSDLVPVPLTLEAEIRVDRDSLAHFAVGKSLHTYQGDELEIVKSEFIPSAKAQGATEVAFVRVTALLKCVQAVAFVPSQALVRYQASLGEVYRAAGARLRGIEGDFAVPRFVCLAGEVPSFHIARALQEAGGVVCWRSGKLAFVALAALFAQAPIGTLPAHSGEAVENGFLERHQVPTFYSTNADGALVLGNNNKSRSLRFVPGQNETALRQMTRYVVLERCQHYAYAPLLRAGDLFAVEGGGRLVVITIASVWEAGTSGEAPRQYSKLWLGRLEE
ncbi:MAG: hypothetical protein ACRCYV_03580 [Aeromonas sp.]